MYRVLLLVLWCGVRARSVRRADCPEGLGLELGGWSRSLRHLDSTVVEHAPAASPGNIFVYENVFPGHAIRYVHVANVAVRTCGAQATLKAGGLGRSSVLLLLYAAAGEEIRAVVDVWGERDPGQAPLAHTRQKLKSTFLYKDAKAPLIPN